MINQDQVKKVAQLANLDLSSPELKKFRKELSTIIEFVSQLDQVSLKGDVVSEAQGKPNAVRSDITRPSLTQEEVLKNAPSVKNNFFKIRKIFEWI